MTNDLKKCMSHSPPLTTYEKLNTALGRFSESLDRQSKIVALFGEIVVALHELTEATSNDFAKTVRKKAALAQAQRVLEQVKKLPGVEKC